MEIKHLIFFKRTAELEHITKAAEELSISQPFLSRSIAELESELGVKLFDHIGRNIVLNEYGKVFYKSTLNILNSIYDAKKEIENLHNKKESQLTIAANVGMVHLPGMLNEIYNGSDAPDNRIPVNLVPARRRDIIQMLRDGKTDYIICKPPLEEDSAFETVSFGKELLALIFPEGHWLEGRETVDFSELTNENFVTIPEGYGLRDTLDRYCKKQKIKIHIGIETVDVSSVIDFVNNGLGIALINYTMAYRSNLHESRYIKVDLGAEFGASLSWRKNQYVSPQITEIIDKLVKLRNA